jgi:hypothetical protein
MSLQDINRVVAWLLLSVIVVLTLVPPSLRPTTFVPHKIEHAAIFLAAGSSFGVAYLGREWLLNIGAIDSVEQPWVRDPVGNLCRSRRDTLVRLGSS